MPNIYIQQKDSTAFLNSITSANAFIGQTVSLFQVPYFGRPANEEFKFICAQVNATTYDVMYINMQPDGAFTDYEEQTAKANNLFAGDVKEAGAFALILISDYADYDAVQAIWSAL